MTTGRLSPRTRWLLALGGGVSFALVGAALAWWVWLPSVVRSRLAETAAQRGLELSVGSVRLGLGSVTLADLRVRSGDALRADVERVEIDAGPWGLATSGSAAVEHVTARGAHVRADLHDTAFRERVARLRGSRSGGGGTSTREIRVDDLAVEVRDEAGILLQLQGGSLELGPREVRVTFAPGSVAPGADDGAEVQRLQASLRHQAGGWRLAGASATHVVVHYREREGEAQSATGARVRAAMRLLGDEQPAPNPQQARPAPSGFDALANLSERLGSHVLPGAVLRVEDLSVVAHNAEQQRVLRDMRAELRVAAGERYRFEGSGRPGRGGRLSWRLELAPSELRAEGDIDFERVPFVLLVPFLPGLPWHQPELARVSGALSVRGRGAERVHLEGDVAIEDLALSSARIAPSPVRHIAVSMRGEADWIPAQRRLDIASMELGMGHAHANLQGALEWPSDHYLLDLRATLPPTDCNTAVGAIPADLLQDTAGFSWDGRLGGRVVARIDSRDLDATVLDIDVADGCRFRTAPAMADVLRFSEPFTQRVVEPDGSIFEMETGPGTSAWSPLARISPFMVHAVLGHEDAGFFHHHGFAVHAIREALVRNLREGRYAYGASTLTMQLVKNVFLHREKTLARKVQEVLLTWWIESAMDKSSILELYLNVIEYGPSVYGIRHAAQHYFGCTPAQLTAAQSAYLAMILPNPKLYHAHWEQGQMPDAFRRRVAHFLHVLHDRGRYDDEALADGLAELGSFRFVHPGDAPACRQPRGHTAPLPVASSGDADWDREDPPPDDQPGWDD